MAHYDLFKGQTFQFTCLYLLVIQVPTLLTLQAMANLPESNPAGLSDIAEFAGQAPADGIPIALGVSSTDSERKLTNSQAQASGPILSKERQHRRSKIFGNVQSKGGSLTMQPAEPVFNDQKLLEQKLKLLQLIDQLGFDEAIRTFQDQIKSEPDWNSEGGSQPVKPRNQRPKIKFAITEPPPTILINDTQFSQLSETQPKMEAANVEKYSGFNGTLEQTVSMTIPRNQNPIPNANLAAPPHHQTNVYIQQTKFHNTHQDISDKSNTQNEQVVVASPIITAQYVDEDKDDDYDSDNNKGDLGSDEDRRKPTEEQLMEAINRIAVTTQKPTDKPKPVTTQRKTTTAPKRTTTKTVKTTRKPTTTQLTTKPMATKEPYEFEIPEPTERIELVLQCPTFLEFVVEAQVFWESLRRSSGMVNTFEMVVQAIVQSMRTLGRCFYRVSTDVIEVILDFFGVKSKFITASDDKKRDVKQVKSSHR